MGERLVRPVQTELDQLTMQHRPGDMWVLGKPRLQVRPVGLQHRRLLTPRRRPTMLQTPTDRLAVVARMTRNRRHAPASVCSAQISTGSSSLNPTTTRHVDQSFIDRASSGPPTEDRARWWSSRSGSGPAGHRRHGSTTNEPTPRQDGDFSREQVKSLTREVPWATSRSTTRIAGLSWPLRDPRVHAIDGFLSDDTLYGYDLIIWDPDGDTHYDIQNTAGVPQRRVDELAAREAVFGSQLLKYATTESLCLISGEQLLRLWIDALDTPAFGPVAAKAILTSVGVFNGPGLDGLT